MLRTSDTPRYRDGTNTENASTAATNTSSMPVNTKDREISHLIRQMTELKQQNRNLEYALRRAQKSNVRGSGPLDNAADEPATGQANGSRLPDRSDVPDPFLSLRSETRMPIQGVPSGKTLAHEQTHSGSTEPLTVNGSAKAQADDYASLHGSVSRLSVASHSTQHLANIYSTGPASSGNDQGEPSSAKGISLDYVDDRMSSGEMYLRQEESHDAGPSSGGNQAAGEQEMGQEPTRVEGGMLQADADGNLLTIGSTGHMQAPSPKRKRIKEV